MVACADNHHASAAGNLDIFYPKQCRGAIYLHLILNREKAEMKNTLLVLLTVVIISGFIIHGNNDSATIIAHLAKKEKGGSGDLVYKIYFMGIIPLGEATIKKEKAETYNGRNVYHLNATAQSAKYFSKIFSAAAELDSYINTQNFNPIFFKQRTVISNKAETKKEVIYDQENNIMTIGSTQRQIFPDTQDPLSAIYNLRRIDFGKTKEFKISLNTNQKNYLLEGKAEAKTEKINNRIFHLILTQAQIRRHDGNPYHKSRVSIVLLKEEGNIPILIKISASGALINAKLIAIE